MSKSIINNNNDNNDDLYWNKPEDFNNSKLFIYSMRYNNDFSLFCLATNHGYRIFCSKTFKLIHIPSRENYFLGDLLICNVYKKSQIIFFVGNESNLKIKINEFYVYNDLNNKILGSIKLKEIINDFHISNNFIFIFYSDKILILEFYSFSIIKIIKNLNINQKLISYNSYDMIAYTNLKNKLDINIQIFTTKKMKFFNIYNKLITCNFNNIQSIQLSQSGQFILVINILGNKIHCYFVQNGGLKICLYLGQKICAIENLFFSPWKETSFIIVKDHKKIELYDLECEESFPECQCFKYDDKKLLGKGNDEESIFNFFKNYFNNEVKFF
jgi:hypothetical protein